MQPRRGAPLNGVAAVQGLQHNSHLTLMEHGMHMPYHFCLIALMCSHCHKKLHDLSDVRDLTSPNMSPYQWGWFALI